MDQRTESIKQEVDETRDSMTTRMEQIESQVQGKIDNVRESAQTSVEKAKETAQETVENVKQKLDIKQMVDERPWTMFGASLVAGFMLGSMGGSESSHRAERSYPPEHSYRYGEAVRYYSDRPYQTASSDAYRQPEENGERYRHEAYRASRSQRSQSGVISTVKDQFGDDIEAFKGALIATATNSLRDLFKETMPRFSEEFDRARKERERSYEEGRALQGQETSQSQTASQTPEVSSSIVAPVTSEQEYRQQHEQRQV